MSEPYPVFHHRLLLERPKQPPPADFILSVEPGHPCCEEFHLERTTIATFGLGRNESNVKLKNRLVIPFHGPDGELIGYAGRWPGAVVPRDKSEYHTLGDLHEQMFNLDRALKIRSHSPVFIVADCLALFHLHQLGFARVVSGLGESLRSNQVSLLLHSIKFPRFICLYDETERGRYQRERALEMLSPYAFVRVPTLRTEGRLIRSLSYEDLASL